MASRILEEGLASSLNDALDQPLAPVLEIMEYRAYAQAKRAVEAAKDQSALPDHPLISLVWEFKEQEARAEMARRKQKRAKGS